MEQCENCKSREGTEELHTCPYAEEINGDQESLCNCCAECQHNCYMDS